MNYLNKNFDRAIKESYYQPVISTIRIEVDAFMATFHDDPKINSEWGHNYFCNHDGGRLIFDLNQPHVHRCEVCGKEYKGELYDGVWVYFYRNNAILTAWKSAFLYKATHEKKYLEHVKTIIGFYAQNYTNFQIHNKERETFDNYEEMKWGCGRILPQGLNESIIAIRMIQALEIVKDDLEPDFINFTYGMFHEMFLLLRPQVNQIHNIRCWNNSAIGVIGLFFNDEEMLNYVFKGEYNICRQIHEGITPDGFWFEGSIHYNFFTLEGLTVLLLFAQIYNYDFGIEEKKVIENMFINAYHYAFSNQYLPNPNDGWPSINLKTYSYIYHTATKIYGEDSVVGNLLKNIENNANPRTTLPLSKPYYVGEIPLERILLNTDIDLQHYTKVVAMTKNFAYSNFAMLRNQKTNVFIKYGLNSPSHAHPDIMNIEVIHGDDRISRDISNAGYEATLCKQWHRKTLAHNTVIVNGKDIISTGRGDCLAYTTSSITTRNVDVYPGVTYQRSVEVLQNGLNDKFNVWCRKVSTMDYVFHLEANVKLCDTLTLVDADLGYSDCGYQHILETKKVLTTDSIAKIKALLNDKEISIQIPLEGKEMYICKTMDNPVNKTRTTIIVRAKDKEAEFAMQLEVKEKNTMEIKHFFLQEEIDGKEVGAGVTRKVLSYNDNLMVCEVHFKKDSCGSLHSHPHEQCTYVISGVFEFSIGLEKQIVKSGDSLYMEPDIIHGAVCLEEGVLLDIFTPCRKDFI